MNARDGGPAEPGNGPWWRRIWEPVHDDLLDAGASGEMLVARIRLAIAAAATLVPLSRLVMEPTEVQHWAGLGVLLIVSGLALGMMALARRDLYRPWYGIVTSALDVTLVSAALVVLVLTDHPLMAANSRVVYEFYFIALAAACLRYDPRVVMVAGGLAIAEYAAVSALAEAHLHRAPAGAATQFGEFSWGVQISRLILLAIATAVSWTIVARTRRLRRLSTTDRLTDLHNRAHFLDRLEEELSRSRRYERPIGVAIIDLDYFKSFNDAYGHAAGDEALRVFASFLRRGMRRTDVIARYGGEEFVILLPETTAAAARDKLESLRAEIATLPVSVGRGRAPAYVTMSGGLALYPDDGETAMALLEKADVRLFDAKHGGRNRVVGGVEPPKGQIVVPGEMQRISGEQRGPVRKI